MTELMLDVENLDAVLGFRILKHKPLPCERPDLCLLHPRLREVLGAPVSIRAILREGDDLQFAKRRKFAAFLDSIGIRVVFAETYARRHALSVERDIVDHVLEDSVRKSRAGTIIAGTHDHSAAPALADQKKAGARIGVLGFTELVADDLARVSEGFILDPEFDLGIFAKSLHGFSRSKT